ncbi:MAG: hypothetical protein OXI82_04840 [Nitrospinae bacterium]|nr:hypothetical protein [Nitrospinota bacterium]
MDSLKILGLIVFFLVSMSSAAAGETHSKADRCLVTLYNYPAETPQYNVSKKTLPQSPLIQEKNNRSSKTKENVHSWMSISPKRSGEK